MSRKVLSRMYRRRFLVSISNSGVCIFSRHYDTIRSCFFWRENHNETTDRLFNELRFELKHYLTNDWANLIRVKCFHWLKCCHGSWRPEGVGARAECPPVAVRNAVQVCRRRERPWQLRGPDIADIAGAQEGSNSELDRIFI